MKIIQEGSVVVLNYRGTFEDGEEFDSSYSRGEPMTCTVGNGSLIPGFDSALSGMQAGQKKSIKIEPDQAYGEYKEGAIMEVPRSSFHENFAPEVGGVVYGRNEVGGEVIAKVVSFDDETVNLDFNHPMAGKTLNFDIEVESVG